ncbi:hypothetical protein KKB40_04375 [Patescibacteria group bacterium]|nr:hypothetical protein [Patescibacteria group bacterium]
MTKNSRAKFVASVVLAILLFINIFLGFRIYQNVVSNFDFYKTITNEAKTEIDIFLKDSPLFQDSENLESFQDSEDSESLENLKEPAGI